MELLYESFKRTLKVMPNKSPFGEYEDMDDKITSFEKFKLNFKKFKSKHFKSCGDNCVHLRRFYQRLQFSPTKPEKEIFTLQKI